MSFLANFFKSGGEAAMDEVTAQLAIRAPNIAGKAQLKGQDQDLDSTGATIQDVKQALREATAEHDRDHAQYSELMGAAEVLQKETDDPNTPADQKASKTISLNNLLGKIEHLVPTVDREQQRVDKLTAQLRQAEELYRQKASDMVQSSADFAEAKNDLAGAELDKQRAQRDAELNKKLSGVSTGPSNSLTAATDALKKKAEEARKQADNFDLKSQTLQQVKQGVQDDPNIQAAIAAAKGTTSPQSLSERMAALRR